MGRLTRTVALVGMMGAGKSSVGRRLATRLDVPFHDADSELEASAGCSISEIFDRFGEAAFRSGERKVIARLLREPPHVLATGGGAFVEETIRAQIRENAISVWLGAPGDPLGSRGARRDTRPLLRGGDPREIIEQMLRDREPVYREADLSVDSEDGPHTAAVERIVAALEERGLLGST